MNQWHIIGNIVSKNSEINTRNWQRKYQQLCIKRWLVANVISFVLQYLGLLLGTLMLPPSLLWFSTGVAVGLVFLRGYKILPGLFLGSFAAYHWAGSTIPLSVLYAGIHSLQAFCIVWLSHKINCYSLIFYRRAEFFKFLLLSACLTAVMSFIITYIYVQQLTSLSLWSLWRYWWLADFTGLLVFGLALTTWDAYIPEISGLRKTPWFPIVANFMLLIMAIIILAISSNSIIAGFSSLCILLLLFKISRSYHWPGAIMACFLLGLILSLASLINTPLFIHFSQARLLLQLGILSLMIVTVACLLDSGFRY